MGGLGFLAGRSVEIDPEELNAALRRAELLLATGGDPRRSPELYGRAVIAIARDLDEPARAAPAALEMLEPEDATFPVQVRRSASCSPTPISPGELQQHCSRRSWQRSRGSDPWGPRSLTPIAVPAESG